MSISRIILRQSRTVVLLAITIGLGACASLQPETGDTSPSPGRVAATDGQVPDTAVSSAAETSSAYRLGEGDVIGIQVFDEPDLTMGASIGASGTINYSYLGDIRVTGKTPQELESELSALLRDGYLVNPSVNVTIEQFRPFFVNGEVRSPGSYSYQPGLTLGKALTLAGGVTDRASTRKISVTRVVEGKRQNFKADLDTVIAPGDIVSVKEGFL